MGSAPLLQVALFRDEKEAHRIGPVVWAVFEEVAALYNFDEKRAIFRRCFLSRWLPPNIKQQEIKLDRKKIGEALTSEDWWRTTELTPESVSESLFSDGDPPPLLATLGEDANYLYNVVSDDYQGTVNKTVLVERVRNLLGDAARDAPLLLVIDQQLTPPPSWNYIIWDDVIDGEAHAEVISTKPIDPRYWGMSTKRIEAVMKQRLRAACCSAVGGILGFRFCHNPSCYLYSPVESVSELDEMNHLGAEHPEAPGLSGMGYADNDEKPSVAQDLVRIDEHSKGA